MIRKQVGDLSTHTTKYTSLALTQKVFANMRRVGKGFSGVDTPLFEGMLVAQEIGEGDADEVHDENVNAADIVAEGVVSVVDNQRVKKLKKRNKLKVLKLRRLKKVGSAQRIGTSDDTVIDDVSKQGGIIANIDADEDVVLEDAKDVVADAKDDQDADVQESVDIQGRTAESQAEIYKIDLDHAKKVLSMQEEESKPIELQELVDVVCKTHMKIR
nr:hypothetical protein [Tanacetum cinerariifolium]